MDLLHFDSSHVVLTLVYDLDIGWGHKLDQPFTERFTEWNCLSEHPNSISVGSSDLQITQSSWAILWAKELYDKVMNLLVCKLQR